jgi:hypothetical protein
MYSATPITRAIGDIGPGPIHPVCAVNGLICLTLNVRNGDTSPSFFR